MIVAGIGAGKVRVTSPDGCKMLNRTDAPRFIFAPKNPTAFEPICRSRPIRPLLCSSFAGRYLEYGLRFPTDDGLRGLPVS
jgi:hypothetical protein